MAEPKGGHTLAPPPRRRKSRTSSGGRGPGQRSTNHPFAHGRRRMLSRSILDDRGSTRVGVSNSESVTGDHRSLRERPHWNGCTRPRVLARDELELRGTRVEVRARGGGGA